METSCVHTCRGLCSALTAAQRSEEETIAEYRRFAEQCDYPDVRVMLERLIVLRQQALRQLRDMRAMLLSRFETLDRINDIYA
jgi:rubrerythrin